MWSCVLIVPAAHLDIANAVGAAMGWGPANFSIPLSAGGGVTHWGLHAWTSDDFKGLIESGDYPAALEGSVAQEDYAAMLAALTSSFRTEHSGHFAAVTASGGLALAE